MNVAVFWSIVISGTIFLILLVATWLIFGRLIMLQIRRWLLASKGYVEIEHISPTNVRNYFIMRPSDKKFEIGDGFYHYIPECINRKGQILKKLDKNILQKDVEILPEDFEGMNDKEKEEFSKKVKAEWEEVRGLYKVISNLKYDPELLNRKMGMPVITYWGDNPDPINFSDREKIYGSGVIRDMFMRLLLTQRYKDFQRIILIGLIALGIIAIGIVAIWYRIDSLANQGQSCWAMLNSTTQKYDYLVNQTLIMKLQGSNFVI